jgi:hypothetical protein
LVATKSILGFQKASVTVTFEKFIGSILTCELWAFIPIHKKHKDIKMNNFIGHHLILNKMQHFTNKYKQKFIRYLFNMMYLWKYIQNGMLF